MQTNTPIIDSLESFERTLNRAQTFAGTPHRQERPDQAAIDRIAARIQRALLINFRPNPYRHTPHTVRAAAALAWRKGITDDRHLLDAINILERRS